MDTHTTLIDPGNAAELARRINQEDLLVEATGGLWPDAIDHRSVKMVLDLRCGPGRWANTVAFEHPEIRVMGTDPSDEAVRYARAYAEVQRLSNITFATMDLRCLPLSFPNATFDLISSRLLSELLDQQTWPQMLAECMRLLRPGGILCLTEVEVSISNSPAQQQVYRSLYHLLTDQQRTYSVDRRSLGICPMLPGLLKLAGFCAVTSRAIHLDGSARAPMHLACCQDLEIRLALLKPVLLHAGIMEEAEYEALHAQMQLDMRNEDFANVSFGLQVWGHAPAHATTSTELGQ